MRGFFKKLLYVLFIIYIIYMATMIYIIVTKKDSAELKSLTINNTL